MVVLCFRAGCTSNIIISNSPLCIFHSSLNPRALRAANHGNETVKTILCIFRTVDIRARTSPPAMSMILVCSTYRFSIRYALLIFMRHNFIFIGSSIKAHAHRTQKSVRALPKYKIESDLHCVYVFAPRFHQLRASFTNTQTQYSR